MDSPQVKLNDLIRIGSHFDGPKAQVVRIYAPDEKKLGLCGDIEVVYWQNQIKGIKDDVIWGVEGWEFKNKGAGGGSYVNIDHYDPRLKT